MRNGLQTSIVAINTAHICHYILTDARSNKIVDIFRKFLINEPLRTSLPLI